MYLKLSSMVEGQLRDAYAKKYEAGELNQSGLADRLGVNRSAVHHRLTGQTNMTIETIADMVWGLDHDIELKIFDPSETRNNARKVVANNTTRTEQPSTALMQIASTAPSSNSMPVSLLGGVEQRKQNDLAYGYSLQLGGKK